jgi:predicted PurR-regulated permease PerM
MNGWQTFYKTVIVLATLAMAALLYLGREVAIILFISILFASAIRPLVDRLVLLVRFRVLAVVLIYLALLAVVVALFLISIPPLIGLTVEFVNGGKLMKQVQLIADQLSLFGWQHFRLIIPTFQLPSQLEALMGQAGEAAQGVALPYTVATLLGISQVVVALIMALYWLTAREQLLQLVLRLSPARQRSQAESIWTNVEETLGAYLRGTVIVMFAVGAMSFAGLVILGVPYAPALAVIAALAEGIPMIGPFIGAVPALIVAFSTSPQTGLLVAIWYLATQEIEAHVLFPKVMERSVGLHPLLVIIALFTGATLNGLVGALIAVPVAGALQVAARQLLIEPALQNQEVRAGATLVLVDKAAEPKTDEEPDGGVILTP